MSDAPSERNSNSKSNLIQVQHVGVTAKLKSPLQGLMMNFSSSTESENNPVLYRDRRHSNTKYDTFLNEASNETDTSASANTNTNTKILYEMTSVSKSFKRKSVNKLTPSKIEFQLYTKPKKRLQKDKTCNTNQKKIPRRQLFETQRKDTPTIVDAKQNSILQCLKKSFTKMKAPRKEKKPTVDKIFDDLSEPKMSAETNKDIRIGIYTFEHGCAEYLLTHDCPPHILSLDLAERATRYATRFWAEVFGSLQIGISFVVAFLLQSYRFILYSLVNILLVEFLHMTSDYFIKPLLAAIFNGFLQPPLIFCFNILSLIRDILEPIADAINNFMKPLATLGQSIRLVHATYNQKKTAKNV